MKKVGILVNSIGYGGNERSAVNIANALCGSYDVLVIIQEDRGNHYGYDGRVISLNTPCAASRAGKAINSVRRIVRLKRMIRQEKIDTLFIILPISNPINYMKFKCRKIVSCRDCGDLIRHTDNYIRMTEKSDLIICNSAEQAEYLNAKAQSQKDKTKVIYNILDISKVHELAAVPIDEETKHFISGHKCITFAGRFAQAKGLNNLLKAFSLLAEKDKGVRLIMIGDGELMQQTKEMIDQLNIGDRILLNGFQENPFHYIAQSDVFVLPSFFEGFPNMLVEAMACGCPVVATNCPSGPSEILRGTINKGYTVTEYGVLTQPFTEKQSTWDPHDITEEHTVFADAIENLLDHEQLSEELAERAMKRAEDFAADRIVNDWKMIL